jgi:hypothetical protein
VCIDCGAHFHHLCAATYDKDVEGTNKCGCTNRPAAMPVPMDVDPANPPPPLAAPPPPPPPLPIAQLQLPRATTAARRLRQRLKLKRRRCGRAPLSTSVRYEEVRQGRRTAIIAVRLYAMPARPAVHRRVEEDAEVAKGALTRHARLDTIDSFHVDKYGAGDPFDSNVGICACECPACGARFWPLERNSNRQYTRCCGNGKVRVQRFRTHPRLRHLLTAPGGDAALFRKHIRKFNMALAFGSFQAGAEVHMPGGPSAFKI